MFVFFFNATIGTVCQLSLLLPWYRWVNKSLYPWERDGGRDDTNSHFWAYRGQIKSSKWLALEDRSVTGEFVRAWSPLKLHHTFMLFSLFFIELFLRIFYSAGGRCGLEKVTLDRQSSQWLCSTSSCIGHGSVRERWCRACDVMMEARGGTRGTLGGLESRGAGHAGSWQENSCNYAVWLRDLSSVENTLLPCYIQTNV